MQLVRRTSPILLAAATAWIGSPTWAQQPPSSPTPPPTGPAASTNAASSLGANAEAYVKFGRSNGANGDLDGAIAAFDEAIKIDPKYPPAYENRGVAKMLQRKLPEAITNFDTAIQLDDKYQDAYYNRGTCKAQLGDFDGSIADFNRAIELSPKYASAYYNRGHAKYFKGDLDGALADTTQAINLESASTTKSPYSYFVRGLVRQAQGDREGATSDFQASANNGFPFGVFWLWIGRMENRDRGIARQELNDFSEKTQLFKPDDWPALIAGYLLEKVSQDQLLTKAKDGAEAPSRQCEAWFYIGVSKRFSGDNKGALDAFKEAIATGSKDSEEYVEAQRQLTRMQAP